jgi:peptide/nickel transport system substrate-binding protein
MAARVAILGKVVVDDPAVVEPLRELEAQDGILDVAPDPYPFWHQAEAVGGQNYTGWDNRPASEYLEQARVTADYSLRTRLYRNFQVVFSKELPALPLYIPVYSYGVDAQVQGVQAGPLYEPGDRLNTFTSWFLLTRRALEQESTPSP